MILEPALVYIYNTPAFKMMEMLCEGVCLKVFKRADYNNL
jgi:hypothetical protein